MTSGLHELVYHLSRLTHLLIIVVSTICSQNMRMLGSSFSLPSEPVAPTLAAPAPCR